MVSDSHLNRLQSRSIDEYAIEKLGLPGIVLMENAGIGCANKIVESTAHPVVVILAGTGNNGGDGFVIARQLQLGKVATKVLVCGDPAVIRGDAKVNFEVLQNLDVPIIRVDNQTDDEIRSMIREVEGRPVNVIVDALVGTGARGVLRWPMDRMVEIANQAQVFRIAIDIPSGLDCDSGQVEGSAFRADLTCTMVTPKLGFKNPDAAQYLGKVAVVPIGVEPSRLKFAGDD